MTKTCPIHGEYESEVMEVFGVHVETQCPMCEAQEKQDAQKKAKIEKVKSIEDAGVPSRFLKCAFQNYQRETNEQQESYDIAKGYCDNLSSNQDGSALFMCGSYGTGKTHLAISILKRHFQETGKLGLYTTTMRMIRDIRSSYGSRDISEQQKIDCYVKSPLLILDEVGVQFGTEGELILLFEVINGRYEEMKPTVLISNLTFKEMEKYLGERCVDRLKGQSGKISIMNWSSYRKRKPE
ncbi:MAG: ATP-binding protein [Spirochaetales bacterium]|nr:ATP-binding protein [Spirochaetales bacterium]